MPKPMVILVSGAPGSGKTTLAERIAEELRWPLIYKDAIKERLHDLLICEDNTRPQKLENASYGLLYYYVECQLRAGQSLIVESNFKPNFETDTLQALQKQYDFIALQVFVTAERDVLVERFRERANSEDRHPVHHDEDMVEDFETSLDQNQYDVMNIDGPVIAVDTTDFEAVDYKALFEEIRTLIKNSPAHP